MDKEKREHSIVLTTLTGMKSEEYLNPSEFSSRPLGEEQSPSIPLGADSDTDGNITVSSEATCHRRKIPNIMQQTSVSSIKRRYLNQGKPVAPPRAKIYDAAVTAHSYNQKQGFESAGSGRKS